MLANWPDTEVVGLYEPQSKSAVLTKDAALASAAAVLKEYQEVAGDFTW